MTQMGIINAMKAFLTKHLSGTKLWHFIITTLTVALNLLKLEISHKTRHTTKLFYIKPDIA